MDNSPKILDGACAIDDRGILTYVNTVPFEKVCRMYTVENFSLNTVRAFHGHKIEEKFIFVISGSAIIVLAEMKDKNLEKPQRYILSARNPQLLYVPAGYVNGFRMLESGTKILFFSTTTVEQTATDDYRFTPDYFGFGIWETKSR